MFKKIFGSLFDSNDKQISDLQKIVDKVNEKEIEFQILSDDELKSHTDQYKKRLKDGETLDDIMVEAFATVKNACRRMIGRKWTAGGVEMEWNMIPYDVQIIGGIVLSRGMIAEMKTGEGKTLVATLPLYLNALSGKGAHLITVNDYLATRDAEWVGEVFRYLGLTVGIIRHGMAPHERKEAYYSDITYGTNNEFGFDYLRDNMVPGLVNMVQRDLNFAIVDEVDSILIDEARTPLIISGQGKDSEDWYSKFAKLLPKLEIETDYTIDEKAKSASLTDEGMAKLEKLMGVENLYDESGVLAHYLDSSLRAHALYKRDKEYVVKDGEVVIVDEFTGRLMEGRRYSEGLHQAIEAKEGVQVKKQTRTLATITFQNYFRLYNTLSGMTGTALTEAEEFDKIYDIDVVAIPTNRPITRRDNNDLIYKNQGAKYRAIAKEVKERHLKGQPVLVGTVAVETSEILSQIFKKNGIPHNVLNAKQHGKEALIVADAGKKGAVTIATNMAGRGTDIKLGGVYATDEEKQSVLDLGGLYVIGSERHESRRIDNQLRGRSGRQGEPGESRFYVATDDDLMRVFGGERVQSMMERLGFDEDTPIENKIISKSLEGAQKRVEGHNFDTRKHLVEYDDVMNKQREVVYGLRRQVLETHARSLSRNPGEEIKSPFEGLVPKDLMDKIDTDLGDGSFGKYVRAITNQKSLFDIMMLFLFQEVDEIVSTHITEEGFAYDKMLAEFRFVVPYDDDSMVKIAEVIKKLKSSEEIVLKLFELGISAYRSKEVQLSYDAMRKAEEIVFLRTIDQLWTNHLDFLSDLRQGIGLRGYGQKDPLVEYKSESYKFFSQLIHNIQSTVIKTIYRVGVRTKEAANKERSPMFKNIQEGKAQTANAFQQAGRAKSGKESNAPVTKTGKYDNVGRNELCPCGSGKKFKKCHGA